MKKILIIASALIVVFASSCKKKNSMSRREMLTTGQWKLTSSKATTNFFGATIEMDLMDSMKVCQKDNLYMLNTEGTITLDEGPTKCDSSTPQTITYGSWSLTANDTKITLIEPMTGMQVTADIVELMYTKLTASYNMQFQGANVTATMVFTKQ